MGLTAIVSSDNPGGSSGNPAEHDPVIVNQMSGVVTVLGSRKQQKRVAGYIDSIMMNSQRQVLIEMTIVEVELSDKFQAGVDWQRLSDNDGLDNNGVSYRSEMLGAALNTSPVFSLGYNNAEDNISATI